MNKGLTYFRLTSPYEGDITKNCALDGYEVDSNFFTLEGRDVKSVNVNGNELVITLLNGETISTLNAFADFTKDISFDFDTTNGVLYIKRNGVTQTITGFATTYNTGEAVATDGTVKGNGKPSNPIGISPMFKTGMYRPVTKVVDTTRCETLPSREKVMPGDRYLTLENISEYGFLYNYEGVKRIACDLNACNSPWRIPTKDDWDDMLNAIEPCDENKDHASATCNRYFGKFAGKLLKSKDFWKLESVCDTSTCINYDGETSTPCPVCTCGKRNPCAPTYCGEYGTCQHKPFLHPNRGIDKYGFAVTPAGYTDDGGQFGYFLERAWFWTASNSQYSNAFTKRFEYDKSTVYQDVISTKYNLSLRLIKDYNGDNYLERENILGMPYSTVLMPSQKKGKAIWTATNIAFSNKCYNPVLPNNGMGITLTKKYFLNEWDGKKWLKNELQEGESVVIVNAPNGNSNIEYRLVKGDLIAVPTAIYNDVINDVTKTLDNLQDQINQETTRAIAKENEIDKNLSAEIERSTNKDNELEQKLNDEAASTDADIQDLKNRFDSTDETIKNINDTLADFGEETKKAFDQINNVLETSINTINGAIAAEIENRVAEDKKLSDAITAETQRATEAETVLQTNIDNEVQRATEAEADLQTAIDTEKSERQAADEEIRTLIDSVTGNVDEVSKRLDAEIENRIQADNNLQKDIDDVNSRVDDLSATVDEVKADVEAKYTELNTKIDKETEERTNADETLDKQLLIGEGSSFDTEKGILTLKSKGGENDIQIQFSFNFGDI